VQELLVKRLTSVRAKNRCTALLKLAKERGGPRARKAFRVTGDVSEVAEAVKRASELGLLTLTELAREVDSIEENGAQHIFLFGATEAGKARLTQARLLSAFPAVPTEPTPGFYADEPARRTYSRFLEGWITVKQVCTETYPEPNESFDDDGQRITSYTDVAHRAIHMLRAHPQSGRVEIRLDRVDRRADETQAMTLLDGFLDTLSDVLDIDEDLTPTPIWKGFPGVLAARDETHMSWDEAKDGTATIRISSRRAGMLGQDIRDHPDYPLHQPHFSRDQLTVFWKLPAGQDGEQEKVHTIMRRLNRNGTSLGKVYVAARVLPEELDHVLSRIRHFAR
jgi:hypothetical protein